MKRIALSILAGAALFGSASAFADPPALVDPASAPECKLAEINEQIDAAIVHIRESPAYGHAEGHYRNAIVHLRKMKEQLAKGCERWVRDGRPAKPVEENR